MDGLNTTHDYARAGYSIRIVCSGWACGHAGTLTPADLLGGPDRDVMAVTFRCSACGQASTHIELWPPDYEARPPLPNVAAIRFAEHKKPKLDFIGLAFAIAAQRALSGANTIPAPDRGRLALRIKMPLPPA